ncbi:MAG TPA: hypothetical protein VEC57_07055 [Candidatus Limnocylindrales bacterium]|nr:hypothetical protein [Candidatus Limnocylindrales bacterium]
MRTAGHGVRAGDGYGAATRVFATWLIAAALTAISAGCVPVVVSAEPVVGGSLLPEQSILVLAAAVGFETVDGRQPRRRASMQRDLETTLQDAAEAAASGATAFRSCLVTRASVPDAACMAFREHSSLLANGVVREAARVALRSAHSSGAGAVLAHAARVRIPGVVWDPDSRTTRTGTAAYTLHAALIDAGSGTILWRNEVLVRELPLTFMSTHNQALRLLYRGFPANGEN